VNSIGHRAVNRLPYMKKGDLTRFVTGRLARSERHLTVEKSKRQAVRRQDELLRFTGAAESWWSEPGRERSRSNRGSR
jgi:hypothetical protein